MVCESFYDLIAPEGKLGLPRGQAEAKDLVEASAMVWELWWPGMPLLILSRISVGGFHYNFQCSMLILWVGSLVGK